MVRSNLEESNVSRMDGQNGARKAYRAEKNTKQTTMQIHTPILCTPFVLAAKSASTSLLAFSGENMVLSMGV